MEQRGGRMLTAKEVAREMQDALEHDNGHLFGDVVTFATLESVVQQAMNFGWDVNAEDIVVLAIGEERDQLALVNKHPALAVVHAQLNFIFETGAEDSAQ